MAISTTGDSFIQASDDTEGTPLPSVQDDNEITYMYRVPNGWRGPFTRSALLQNMEDASLDPAMRVRIVSGPSGIGTMRRLGDITAEATASAPEPETAPAEEPSDVVNFGGVDTATTASLLITASTGLGALGAESGTAATASKGLGALGAALAIYTIAQGLFGGNESDTAQLKDLINGLYKKLDQLEATVKDGFQQVHDDFVQLFNQGAQTQELIRNSTQLTLLTINADVVREKIGTIMAAKMVLENYFKAVVNAAVRDEPTHSTTNTMAEMKTGYWAVRMRQLRSSEIFDAAFKLSRLCKQSSSDPIEINLFQSYYNVTYGNASLLADLGAALQRAIGIACIIDSYLTAAARNPDDSTIDIDACTAPSAKLYEGLLDNVKSATTYWVAQARASVLDNVQRVVKPYLGVNNCNWPTTSASANALTKTIFDALRAEMNWLNIGVTIHSQVVSAGVMMMGQPFIADTPYTTSVSSPALARNSWTMKDPTAKPNTSSTAYFDLLIVWEEAATSNSRPINDTAAADYAKKFTDYSGSVSSSSMPAGYTAWRFSNRYSFSYWVYAQNWKSSSYVAKDIYGQSTTTTLILFRL